MLLHPKELCEVLLADRPVDSKTVILFTEPIYLGQGSREAEFQLQTSTLGMKTEFAKLKMAKRKYFCKRCGPSSHDMFEERLNNEDLSLLIHTKMFHPRKLYWVLRYVHLTYSQASQIFPYLDLKMSSMGEYICYICSQSFADFDDFLEHANNKHLKNESARS